MMPVSLPIPSSKKTRELLPKSASCDIYHTPKTFHQAIKVSKEKNLGAGLTRCLINADYINNDVRHAPNDRCLPVSDWLVNSLTATTNSAAQEEVKFNYKIPRTDVKWWDQITGKLENTSSTIT